MDNTSSYFVTWSSTHWTIVTTENAASHSKLASVFNSVLMKIEVAADNSSDHSKAHYQHGVLSRSR